MHQIVPALLPCVLIALGLMASLFLFLALKRELRRSVNRSARKLEEIATRLNEAQSELPEAAVAVLPAPVRSGFNVNRRVQAMRMLRRGEDVAHVAAALGVPRREVELLIHVQKLSLARVNGVAREARSAAAGSGT
jgi:hypothetical protein